MEKKLKLHLLRQWLYEIKQYLLLSIKYGIFSGELIFGNSLYNRLYHKVIHLFYSFGFDTSSALTKGMEYAQYAVKLKNASVLGNSNLIVLSSGQVLYDLPFYNEENRYLYTDYKILKIKNGKITYWKGIKQTIDQAVWMGGNFSWNFYHFIYEFAIKFRKLNELDIPEDIPVLIDQKCLDIPQFKEIIDMLNEKNHPLTGVAKDGFFEVNELFYINCQNFIPPNNRDGIDVRTSDFQFDAETLRDLRRFLLSHASSRIFPKRIFISRGNASDLRHFNEDELIQVCVDFGFEVVYPEKLSFCEQISLFNRAEWIIGGSGAAFASLLFCNPHGKAIIVSKTLTFSGFTTLAQISGVDLRVITEEIPDMKVRHDKIHDSYIIDVSVFRNYLIDNGC
jgi:hypothetical protein